MRIFFWGQATTESMSQIETDGVIFIKGMILTLDTKTHPHRYNPSIIINIINCTILVITTFTPLIAHTGVFHLRQTKSCIAVGKQGKKDLLLILHSTSYCKWHFLVSKVHQEQAISLPLGDMSFLLYFVYLFISSNLNMSACFTTPTDTNNDEILGSLCNNKEYF